MKEAKRLKEFLEDYDDERDDPKFYRFFFFLPAPKKFMHFPFAHQVTGFSSFSHTGEVLCRSESVTGKRRWSWMSVTGRGRKRSWRRSDRDFWLRAILTLMLSCREWVTSCGYSRHLHSSSLELRSLVWTGNIKVTSFMLFFSGSRTGCPPDSQFSCLPV